MAGKYADRFEWERIIRRTTLHPTVMLVALVMSTYADYDGSRIRPGTKKLIAVTGLSRPTILRTLAELRDMGLIEKTGERFRAGRNKGGADEYQLTVPCDPGVLEMLDPDEERVSPVTPVLPSYPRVGLTGETRSELNGSHATQERVSSEAGTGLTRETPPIQDQPQDQPHDTPVINSPVEGSKLSTGQERMSPIERAAWRAIRSASLKACG